MDFREIRPRPRRPARAFTPVVTGPLGIKIEAGYGRLYVSGPRSGRLASLPGAATNPRRNNAVELSLTLETLRRIREKMECTSEQLATACTRPVMAWARAAGRSEKQVAEMHRRLAQGWRATLPWYDNRADTVAPEWAANDPDTYLDEQGVRRWKYLPPFEHQKVMASVATEIDGCAFLCEMGTGKTRAAIEAISERARRGQLQAVFVTCPARVLSTWEREVPRWSRNLEVVILDGSVRKRADRIRAWQPGGLYQGTIFVLNHEVLASLQEPIAGLLARVSGGILIDESHKVKNPQAQITKAALEIARASIWRLLMSGTPITGKYQDVWPQWYCVDLGITFGANFSQFKAEFFTPSYDGFNLTPRADTAEIFQNRIARRALRYKKDDCMDLPPKMYSQVTVEMSREQKQAYHQMAEYLIAKLDEEGRAATASTQLTMMLRLAQITSGFVKDAEGAIVRFEPNPKLQACNEIVREEIESGHSVIVWAWYIEDVDRLVAQFRDLNPVVIRGGQTRADHAEAERKFQQRETRLLIANQASGGTGITLTAASVAVYYSQGYSMTDRVQSEDRCHRAGSQQHSKITYIDISCAGTIDELVRGAILRKLDMAAAVVEFRQHIEENA